MTILSILVISVTTFSVLIRETSNRQLHYSSEVLCYSYRSGIWNSIQLALPCMLPLIWGTVPVNLWQIPSLVSRIWEILFTLTDQIPNWVRIILNGQQLFFPPDITWWEFACQNIHFPKASNQDNNSIKICLQYSAYCHHQLSINITFKTAVIQ